MCIMCISGMMFATLIQLSPNYNINSVFIGFNIALVIQSIQFLFNSLVSFMSDIMYTVHTVVLFQY